MATKTRKKRTTSVLDPLMAGFAAGAAAFIVYVMPNDAFSQMVELSGLPLVLPAAQPPLGMTARLAAVAAAGIGTFALVWLVLRALGKKGPEPKRAAQPVEIEVPLPRIRRADAHPDAPARRPILAGLDLGEPFDQTSSFPEAVSEDALPAEDEEEAEFSEVEEEQPAWDHPFAEPVADEQTLDEEPLELSEESVDDMAERLPEPAAFPEASIPHLMQRLELGLLRRGDSLSPAPASLSSVRHSANDTRQPPQIDDRLRSAIEDLQKLAARGG
jgi:hypothetical protein